MWTRTKTVSVSTCQGVSREIYILTFGVVFVRMLEVLDDTVLADDLLDLALGLDVERVLIQQGNLVLALALIILLLALHRVESFSPTVGVVEGGEEFRLALSKLFLCGRVAQEVLSYIFWIGLSSLPPPWVYRLSHCIRRVPSTPDEHSKHFSILDSGPFERLCLVGEGLAVEVEALVGGGEAGLGLDEALEILDGEPRGQVESQQFLIRGLIRRVDGYCDAWPIWVEVSRGF